jgi:hypothetical protein
VRNYERPLRQPNDHDRPTTNNTTTTNITTTDHNHSGPLLL